MRNAGEKEFGNTPWNLGEHREDHGPHGQPDVVPVLHYG
jgi:hypothetical protein